MQEEIIALDGKRIKASNVHLLHVLATQCGIVLAQVDIDNKVNEGKEILEILEKLDIEGGVITADALNCQKAIVGKITDKGAHYCLALKGNQGTLFDDAKSHFLDKAKWIILKRLTKNMDELK